MIERAGIRKRANLDEQNAFRRLQKMASQQNLRMVQLAQMIVTAERTVQDCDARNPLCQQGLESIGAVVIDRLACF